MAVPARVMNDKVFLFFAHQTSQVILAVPRIRPRSSKSAISVCGAALVQAV